ncbi:LPXTG cell wall anchor domain-containing protein [Jeotgalicoccus huakuii]|nr:LPXTG cell wall anchor domain-containing protein [Jeotgalicoccus huakuii]
MKYKSRLIIPTLLSTSLLASTMVASADEIDQEEKTYEQNLETHYEEENGKVDNLADDDADESDESEEVVEEEDTEESLESDEEAAPEDEESEVDEDVDELESTETAEEAPIEEDVQSEEETVENTASTSENETAAVQESEVTTEAVTEVPSQEESNLETEEETDTTVESTETTVEETTEENTDSTTVSESVEEPAQDVEEVTSETEETSEAVAEAPSQEGSNIEADEETDTIEVEENVESDESSEEETVETSKEESNPESEEATDATEVETTDQTVKEPTKENAESNTESETEEIVETEETVEKDTSTTAESEEATYKYDSETLTNELENKSAEERTAFIEENADKIEADEETLKELTQAVEDELGVEIDENLAFNTMSTMSMSQAITDINSYIAENNFEVAEIQYDIIDYLPQYAYESNIGWEPENGKVGQPSGVVLHDVGNDNSTIHGEISYMSENWENAFVHAFVDADNIIQVANTDYLAYGAGPVSNDIHLQVELVRHDNQHDFARSINNYADYIANLLYKYKLPAERADSSGNGTLWSHVEVSNILGGTASPDPYEYFQSHGYAYEDVISLIQGRYNNLYNKVNTPSIYMPTFEGDTSNLAGSITNQNRGIYESITDVKTADASNYLGKDVRVVRSEIYNYEEYYLLENVSDGSTIGWMYAGDVATSSLPEAPIEDDDEGTDNSGDGSTPEVPVEDDDEGTDNSGDGSTPETPVDDDEGTDNSGDDSTPEAPIEDDDEGTDYSGDDSTSEVPVDDDDESESADDSNEDSSKDENRRDDVSEDNTSEDSTEDQLEQPTNGDNESEDETEEVIGRDESTDIDDDNGETTDDVSSSLEDPETGVRVYSASDELVGKQLEVTVLNPSNAIDATHDLYDIHILNSDGSLYNLNNPVTVYLPANGYVSNLYYLGDIGETLEAISYRTDDDYVVFETSSFSQYAVVYGESNKENTIIPPTSEKHGGDSSDGTNTHSKVYTENVGQVDQAEASISTNEVKGNTQKDSNQEAETTDEQDEEVAVLPNTGVKEQGTTVFAALLAALGLGFLVRRRKSGEEKQ